MIYIAVLCNSRITAEPLYNTPLVDWTICRCQQYGAFASRPSGRGGEWEGKEREGWEGEGGVGREGRRGEGE